MFDGRESMINQEEEEKKRKENEGMWEVLLFINRRRHRLGMEY